MRKSLTTDLCGERRCATIEGAAAAKSSNSWSGSASSLSVCEGRSLNPFLSSSSNRKPEFFDRPLHGRIPTSARLIVRRGASTHPITTIWPASVAAATASMATHGLRERRRYARKHAAHTTSAAKWIPSANAHRGALNNYGDW